MKKKHFFYAKIGIKSEKLDPKSQYKNSPKYLIPGTEAKK